MNPSPFFRGVIVTLIALALIAWTLLQNAVYAAEMSLAPVVKQEGDVLVQIGWHRYERPEGVLILYCIPEGDVTLSCVVWVETPKGNGIVLVGGVKASEVRS